MLLVKRYQDELPEGKWYDFELWGATIGIKIRPRTNEIVKQIRNKYRRKKGRDWEYDEEAINDAVMDYIIEDFRGVGEEETGEPWEVSLDTKKRLMALPVPVGEQSLYLRVIDRANEQGFEIREEEIKN